MAPGKKKKNTKTKNAPPPPATFPDTTILPSTAPVSLLGTRPPPVSSNFRSLIGRLTAYRFNHKRARPKNPTRRGIESRKLRLPQICDVITAMASYPDGQVSCSDPCVNIWALSIGPVPLSILGSLSPLDPRPFHAEVHFNKTLREREARGPVRRTRFTSLGPLEGLFMLRKPGFGAFALNRSGLHQTWLHSLVSSGAESSVLTRRLELGFPRSPSGCRIKTSFPTHSALRTATE